ncbi:MAG: RNA-binding domain-containing protein [Planctomycetota bacterium]
MDPMLLERLLRTEDERVEWKESTRDTTEIAHAACALANDLGAAGKPGYLLLGVRKNGTVVGLSADAKQLDEEQKRLADLLRSTKILPSPSVDIATAERNGKVILIVRIEPYPVPPVVEVNGVAWVRVGSTTRRANPADLSRLRERRPENQLSYDSRSVLGADIDDLDTSRLRTEHEAARDANGLPETFPPFEAWLTQNELGRPLQGTWKPSTAAVLVYGRSPQTHFPGAFIEFARYGGIDATGPLVARKTITGTLPDQLDSLWSILAANLVEVPASELGMRQIYAPQYPLEALRELGRNMVQHRQFDATHAPGRIEWYEDRIEFSNPGRPFGRASEGEFGEHADYRNPAVTKLLVRLGYVERLGRGIRLVGHLLHSNGNPPLVAETGGFTRVVIRKRP